MDSGDRRFSTYALVTGAASGMGRLYAQKLARKGYSLILVDIAADRLEETASEIRNEFADGEDGCMPDIRTFTCDLSKMEAASDVAKAAEGCEVEILVNNAGITKDGLMMRMSEGQWDAVINVNLKSAFNFIHACTPIMMRQRSGNIINMASVVGVHGNAGQCNYAASKAGLIALAKSIAQELGSRGIRANAIAPGFIITDMTAQLSDEVKAEWNKRIPLRRGGTPEDVANIALFLASDMSSYVSGQVIQVDGGMNM